MATSVTLGRPRQLSIIREIREDDPLLPGHYLYIAEFKARPETLTESAARERLQRVIEKVHAQVSEINPDLVWYLESAGLRYDEESQQGLLVIHFRLEGPPYAALPLLAKIVIGLLAGALLAYLAFSIIRATVYLVEPVVAGVKEGGELTGSILTFLIPAALIIVVLLLLTSQ